jgi:uncharacterized damage-inducible protein DinB
MPLSIPAADLLRWNDTTALHWRDFLLAHPEILTLPCTIRNSETVGHLLQHIVAVELRYAQRLASLPESPYNDIPHDSPSTLFATHTLALDLIRPLLADDAYDWSQPIDFTTISMGPLRSTRQSVLVHLLLHGIRHYAQLATLVRSAGFTPDWSMDYLFVDAMRLD